MIYTKSSASATIMHRVDLELTLLSPTTIQNTLLNYAGYLNTDNMGMTIINVPVDYMVGVAEQPDEYTIERCTPRIAVYVHPTNEDGSVTFEWYNGNTTVTVQKDTYKQDCIAFLQVPDTGVDRLMYNGKVVHILCRPKVSDVIYIFFNDLWGLPQCCHLILDKFAHSYEAEDSYRSFNSSLDYEYQKKPACKITTGDEGINEEFREFFIGFCQSDAYIAQNNEGKLIKVSMTGAQSTADKYNKPFGVTAEMLVPVEVANTIYD